MSSGVISTFSSIGPIRPALVRMLSVLVCSTRSAPAASAASSTLTVPWWFTRTNSAGSRAQRFGLAAR